jgi:hypothetical protein
MRVKPRCNARPFTLFASSRDRSTYSGELYEFNSIVDFCNIEAGCEKDHSSISSWLAADRQER